MPTLTTSSTFSQHGDQYSLSVRVSHDIVLGTPGLGVYAVSAKQLQNLDVAPWPEGVCLVLRAAEHRATKISTDVLRASALFGHFRDSLLANSTALGVDDMEERVEGDKLFMHLTVDPPSPSRPPQLYLRAIHLDYVWKATLEGAEAHIFSPILLLPDVSVLDTLFQRFAAYHLVGRYPLIFGPYSRTLDAERAVFPSIARNILTIAVRSPNASMRKSTRKLISRMRASHERETELVASQLSLLAPNADDLSEPADEERLTDTRAITFALERLYRKALRPRRFKPKLPSNDPSRKKITRESHVDSDLDIDDGDDTRSPELAPTNGHTLEPHNDVFGMPGGIDTSNQEINGDEDLAQDMLDLFAAGDSDDALDLLDEDEPLDETFLFSDDEDAILSGDDDLFSPPYSESSNTGRSTSRQEHHTESVEYGAGLAPINTLHETPRNTDEEPDIALDFDMATDDVPWPPTPDALSPSPNPHFGKPYSASHSPPSNPVGIDAPDLTHSFVDDDDYWTLDDEQDLSHSPSTPSSLQDLTQEEHSMRIPESTGTGPCAHGLFDLDIIDHDCLSFDDD